MTRQSYISYESARSAPSKAGPIVSVVGAPATDRRGDDLCHPLSQRSAPAPDRRLRVLSSSGLLLLDPKVVWEAASLSRCVLHSVSLGRWCARCAADCPRRAALRVRTPWLACCAAGWSRPGGRARSESVLAPYAMLAWPVSIELIDLPFSHSSYVALKQIGPPN